MDWAALLDDDDDTDRSSLVDRLAPAFAALRRHGMAYIRHTLIPVLQHTEHLHAAIENDLFPRCSQGLSILDGATLRYENAARRDLSAAQAVYHDAKRDLDALCASLDDLARQSDDLFQAFKTTMLKHVQQLRLCADQMPTDADRLISTLDKKARHLGAEDHAKAKESLLRGILEKY